MSLRKKSTTTEASIAASQANGRRSHGPATPEGRERIRAAHTRHGFYSQAEAMALTCLGEDPADLERLRRNLHRQLAASQPFGGGTGRAFGAGGLAMEARQPHARGLCAAPGQGREPDAG